MEDAFGACGHFYNPAKESSMAKSWQKSSNYSLFRAPLKTNRTGFFLVNVKKVNTQNIFYYTLATERLSL